MSRCGLPQVLVLQPRVGRLELLAVGRDNLLEDAWIVVSRRVASTTRTISALTTLGPWPIAPERELGYCPSRGDTQRDGRGRHSRDQHRRSCRMSRELEAELTSTVPIFLLHAGLEQRIVRPDRKMRVPEYEAQLRALRE